MALTFDLHSEAHTPHKSYTVLHAKEPSWVYKDVGYTK